MTVEKLSPYLLVVILGLGIYVALSPGLFYAPTPRIVLFFIISVIPAILFGNEAKAKFDIKLPGFIFSVVGSGAIFFGSLFLLDKVSKPAIQIAVYQFYDERSKPVALDGVGVFEIRENTLGTKVNSFIRGNTLVVIFPEQIGEIKVELHKTSLKSYTGILDYTGVRESEIYLGKDLKLVNHE